MIRHLTLCALLLAGSGAFAAEAPKVERLKTDQWCWTHDIPKTTCAACDRKLIPALKKAKDWCGEHDIAESVCVKCDSKAKDRLDAQRPADKPKDAK